MDRDVLEAGGGGGVRTLQVKKKKNRMGTENERKTCGEKRGQTQKVWGGGAPRWMVLTKGRGEN